MRIAGLICVATLAVCASIGKPTDAGMTCSQPAATCTDGGRLIVSEMIDVLVGECAAMPDEYVVFNSGAVAQFYNRSAAQHKHD